MLTFRHPRRVTEAQARASLAGNWSRFNENGRVGYRRDPNGLPLRREYLDNLVAAVMRSNALAPYVIVIAEFVPA